MVVALDITQYVLKRQQVERSNEELKNLVTDLDRSNQGLQEFAHVASHDLQEPLRKIHQFGDILQTKYGYELGQGIDYLERMQTVARRMSVLIDDLLNYSRISTQQEVSIRCP